MSSRWSCWCWYLFRMRCWSSHVHCTISNEQIIHHWLLWRRTSTGRSIVYFVRSSLKWMSILLSWLIYIHRLSFVSRESPGWFLVEPTVVFLWCISNLAEERKSNSVQFHSLLLFYGIKPKERCRFVMKTFIQIENNFFKWRKNDEKTTSVAWRWGKGGLSHLSMYHSIEQANVPRRPSDI